jgi:DNA-binding ferritin-like protein
VGDRRGEHEEVADFLEAAYKRVRELNDDLAARIVELGGIPPNTPATIQERAEVHLEAEDLYDLRASLDGDLEGYGTLIVSMREHIALAEGLADSGTAELLRGGLEDLEADADEIERFLEDETLGRSEELKGR